MNFIKSWGQELEGYWENPHESFKHDGSVEIKDVSSDCDGSCMDDCCCYDDCTCDDCQVCENCERFIGNCACYECLKCAACDNYLDDCTCEPDYIRQDDCNNKECKKGSICDDCINTCADFFDENRETYRNCNTINNCDHDCDCECECECSCTIGGEITSGILQNKEQIKDFMLNNYPDKHNSTCGRHDHFEFNRGKLDVYYVSRKEFYDKFIKAYKNFGIVNHINPDSRFYKRLDGNYYCKPIFNPKGQLKDGFERYTHINFCSYKKFKTVEFRLGNIFDNKELSVRYTDFLDSFINNYLENCKPKIYEIDLKVNREIHINLKMQMTEKGLKIFFKSKGIEDLFYSDDYSQYDKFYLYHRKTDFDQLKTNLESLYNEDKPNMTFLRLKNQSSGKSIYINDIFTDEEIIEYQKTLMVEIPRFINGLRELIINVCN